MTWPGLQEKLDYLEWLGVDCLWLLPYYPSPMRDGGYDISDFFTMHPDLGTVDDLVMLLDDAHRRGIRIIADLVMNHTSDEHPWFVESRATRDEPEGGLVRLERRRPAMARGAGRLRRRGDVQLDLGPSASSSTGTASTRTSPTSTTRTPKWSRPCSAWSGSGSTSGSTGSASTPVSYLFQRDGTTGENLPETHALLRRLRKEVDSQYPGRVLLAEANQWPADLVDYFGQGDECQMCFHFPLMPRLFMAVRREQRFPITEILARRRRSPTAASGRSSCATTTSSPSRRSPRKSATTWWPSTPRTPGCGGTWGSAGGSHLCSTVTGVWPSCSYALLLSLPGSPFLYYGDELLMGDNIYLGDRDSVRTPMQWSPDRNGGFTKADFAQLYLPPLMDPVYGFQSVNVEAQQRNPSSFLHWIRTMLQTRSQFPVFGTGTFDVVACANPSVLAYVRSPRPLAEHEIARPRFGRTTRAGRAARTARAASAANAGAATGAATAGATAAATARATAATAAATAAPEGAPSSAPEGDGLANSVLCVHNLSRFAQPAELDLARWSGRTPVELLGRIPFPPVTGSTYEVTLGPYGFYWFELLEDLPASPGDPAVGTLG